MGKFEVDTEYIQEAIDSLIELKGICEENSKKKAPKSKNKDKGLVHDQLKQYSKAVKGTWMELNVLIESTIEFLGGAQNTYDQADQQGAAAVKKK